MYNEKSDSNDLVWEKINNNNSSAKLHMLGSVPKQKHSILFFILKPYFCYFVSCYFLSYSCLVQDLSITSKDIVDT